MPNDPTMPITIQPTDLVICGRGAIASDGDLPVPDNIELYSFQTPGSTMPLSTVSALLGMRTIDRLVRLEPNQSVTDLAESEILTPKRSPEVVQNVRLGGLDNLMAQVRPLVAGVGNQAVLLEEDTDLKSILEGATVKSAVQAQAARGTSLRLFLVDCDFDESGSRAPRIFHNARAVALSATAYAQLSGNPVARRASVDAMRHARIHPDDTSGAMMAAAMIDSTAAVQSKPVPNLDSLHASEASDAAGGERNGSEAKGTPGSAEDKRIDLAESALVAAPDDLAAATTVAASNGAAPRSAVASAKA